MYIFSNILGVFLFDENINIVEEIQFNNIEDKNGFIQKIKDKHNGIKEPNDEITRKILLKLNDKKYFNEFRSKNLQQTKADVKNSVGQDTLLIQSVRSIGELDKAINLLVKRLREWYELYNPEFSVATENSETFVEEIIEKEKNELLAKLSCSPEESMGANLNANDFGQIKNMAQQTYDLYQLRKSQLEYISAIMDELCPNIKTICGTQVGAKLIEHAGSLKRLSAMPSSTIQILGAEKALFRHMKTGAKSPRHGLIIAHILISRAQEKMHGKIARVLADKISIASKIDYFNGKFIGDKLKKELEGKFGDY